MKKFAHFLNDESGATAIEYALLAGLIGVGIVTAATTLSGSIQSFMTRLGAALDAITF